MQDGFGQRVRTTKGGRIMDIDSTKFNKSVLVSFDDSDTVINFEIYTRKQAQTMIAQFRDVMEDFYRTWPELREEAENGLI
jgi:hypothetical protein